MSEEGKYSEELVGSLRQVSAHYKAEGRHQDAQAVQKRLVDLIKEKPNHDKEELQEAVNDQAASLRAMVRKVQDFRSARGFIVISVAAGGMMILPGSVIYRLKVLESLSLLAQ